jgi:hypothetical protein
MDNFYDAHHNVWQAAAAVRAAMTTENPSGRAQ